jgi:hypothetical protein
MFLADELDRAAREQQSGAGPAQMAEVIANPSAPMSMSTPAILIPHRKASSREGAYVE